MGKRRAACCDSSQVKRGAWSDEESERLRAFIETHGHYNWRILPKLAGLKRCGKSCRLRWINYLKPGLKRGNFTKEEEDTIISLHQSHGTKWSMIASHLPGRTDNEIKNVWNTHLKKRLMKRDSSSSDVTNHHQASSMSSSSSSSPVTSVFMDGINSEGPNQVEENFAADMACGFEVDAPQSLESLFQDHQTLPPTSMPESLEILAETDRELWNRVVDEPGLGDYNEWLSYLDNHLI